MRKKITNSKLIAALFLMGALYWGCKKEEEGGADTCNTGEDFFYGEVQYDMCKTFQVSTANETDLTVDVTDGTAKQLYGSGGDDYGYRARLTFKADAAGLAGKAYRIGTFQGSTSTVYKGNATLTITIPETNQTITADSGRMDIDKFVSDDNMAFVGLNVYANGKSISSFLFNDKFSEINASDLVRLSTDK